MTSRCSAAVILTGAAPAIGAAPSRPARVNAIRRFGSVLIVVLQEPDGCCCPVRPEDRGEVPGLLQAEDDADLGREVRALGLDPPGPDARQARGELRVARLRNHGLDHGALVLVPALRDAAAHAGDERGELQLRGVAIL